MAAVQSMHVLSSIDKLAHGMADLYDKEFEEQIERLSNAAKLMEEMGKTAEVKQLRDALVKLQGQITNAKRHESALKKLRQTYAPNGVAATDFAGDLSKLRGEMSAEQEEAWKKDADTELRKFDEEVWEVNHPGEPMPGTGDDDDDDEIRDVGGSNQLAPNTKCPICSKELLFTVDPVQDQKGFVYCREHIEEYIRKGKGKTKCPQAGTSHEVRKEDLKPAKYVIRQQKRAAKQGAGAGGSSQPQTQRGKQAEQVVIDEEDEDFA